MRALRRRCSIAVKRLAQQRQRDLHEHLRRLGQVLNDNILIRRMRGPRGAWTIRQRWDPQLADHIMGIIEAGRNRNGRTAPVDLRVTGGDGLTDQAVSRDRGSFDPQVLLEFYLHLWILSLKHLYHRADLVKSFLDGFFGDEAGIQNHRTLVWDHIGFDPTVDDTADTDGRMFFLLNHDRSRGDLALQLAFEVFQTVRHTHQFLKSVDAAIGHAGVRRLPPGDHFDPEHTPVTDAHEVWLGRLGDNAEVRLDPTLLHQITHAGHATRPFARG